MTCTICGNAHSDECSVAALKAMVVALTAERVCLTIDAPVTLHTGGGAIRVRKIVPSAEIDTLRAQLTALTAKADPRIGDLTAKVRGWAATNDDIRVLCDVAERVALLEALVAEKDEALAEALATLLNERGEGEPPEPGWAFRVTRDLQGVWETEQNGGMVQRTTARGWYWTDYDTVFNPKNVHPTARAAMRAANAARKG